MILFLFVLNLVCCVANASSLRDGRVDWISVIIALWNAFGAGWTGSELLFKR